MFTQLLKKNVAQIILIYYNISFIKFEGIITFYDEKILQG